MHTRLIGALEVTVVGVGCNNFGRELDAAATRQVVHAALDEGVAFFDTADTYGEPKTASETLLGEILAPHRDKVVIATKFGRRLDGRRGGASPAYVRAATEASLRRLRTDHIDLMQLHIPDPDTPIEDTLGALSELVAEGKIREIGASNFTAEQLRATVEAADAHGAPRFASTQAQFNLLHRTPVAGILAECEQTGMKLIPFRPLYHGLLTGKYGSGGSVPADSRIGAKSPGRQAELLTAANLAAVAALTGYAQARGRTLLELAFGWLLGHAAVPSVIAGASSPRQVKSNAAAAGWRLTAEEMTEVGRLLASQG